MMSESIWRSWLKEFPVDSNEADIDLLKSVASGNSRLDGVMSPLTKDLLKKFACKDVDMDILWAYTPMTWACPSCLRSKDKIARRNKNGDLMCRLVDHHDHMKDLLVKKFEHISAGLDKVVANEAAKKFAKRCAPMVSAFDNTVICNDCNNADAKAKKLAGADTTSFSYSPSEINVFIIVTPNKEHEVDKAIAQRIWEKNRKTFELRMKVVDRIAEIAAKNEHWYQNIPFHYHPDHIKQVAESVQRNSGAVNALHVLCGQARRQPQKDVAQ